MKCLKKFSSMVFAFSLVFLLSSLAFGAPNVNVMPDGKKIASDAGFAYTWAGNNLTIWGNVKGNVGTSTYEWDIDNDGSADYSGTVTNAKDIACTHAYTTAGPYDAKLTVTDSNGDSDSAIVRIDVLPTLTKKAQINLAIERGLKWLYLHQGSNGSIYSYNSNSSAGAETAAAVLAFENRGHKPCTQDLDLDGDVDANDRALWEKDNIYAETVHKGLDYAISTLTSFGIAALYDSNGNGVAIADNYCPTSSCRGYYKIGMYMMALVGAGDVASGAPNLVATTGPVGVIGKTYSTIVEDMVDYCDYGQYHSTYGGWRYRPNQWPDNSACQWPVIGMEAAEFGWNLNIRQVIKDTNFNWVDYSQYFTGYSPTLWYYGALGYTGKGTGIARTGSGICQLCFQGKVKDHARILAAAKYLSGNTGGNMYDMYAVTKGCRIAKIDTDSDGIGDTYSEIETLNGWNWYDTYSTTLLNQQQPNGSWLTTYQQTFDTAWAVEILTKNVFILRPIADLDAIPNPTPANSPIDFDISGSHHQDGTKLLTAWDIDVENDGTFDISGSFPTGTIPYAVGYADTGSDYSVTARLRVTDNIGDIGEDLLVINVTSGNVAPVADPGGPYNGPVGQPITFDGSASYDPNEGQGIPGDQIVSWEWDLDGDGQYDDATGEIVQNTWQTPYQGSIGLKVTDDTGLSSTSQTTVYTEIFVVDLWPENYILVSRTRINRYVYDYEYQFDMRNRGSGDAFNVECTIDSVPAQITVVDDHVDFGDIDAGTVVTSLDTFKFRQDRRYPVADFQIRWKLEYDDTGGNHVTFLDFPLR